MVRAFAFAASILALVSAARAGISWSATSEVAIEVASPPVHLQVGAGASGARYAAFTVSANATRAEGTFQAIAGADLAVQDVLRVLNTDDATRTVTLSTTQVVNARVELLQWTLRDGATPVATLDALSATPQISFSLPAGETRTLDLRVDLADGAGTNNATLTLDVSLTVASGGITHVHAASAVTSTPVLAPVAFGRLAASSAVGTNATNASATVTAAVVVLTTTNVWYLNNTNATGAHFAKLSLLSSASISDVTSLTIGIDNGTASTAQIVVTVGSLLQSSGAYVRLEPGATVRIYVTHLLTALHDGATFAFEVHVADDDAETARYTLRAGLAMS